MQARSREEKDGLHGSVPFKFECVRFKNKISSFELSLVANMNGSVYMIAAPFVSVAVFLIVHVYMRLA